MDGEMRGFTEQSAAGAGEERTITEDPASTAMTGSQRRVVT
jgi:hypothetical protein